MKRIDENAIIYIFIFFICPVLGLLLGAILPPFVWPEDRGLLIGLNIGGFLFYAPAAIILSSVMCADEPKTMGEEDLVHGVLLASALYLLIVAISRLLSRYRRSRKPR